MTPSRRIDATDEAILALLAQNARLSLTELGAQVNLSPAAVGRRIKRLEDSSVIRGYTIRVDDAAAGAGLQAFIELRFAGTTRVGDIGDVGGEIEDVKAVFTTAGDPDALVWVQVSDVGHLRRTIDRLRSIDHVRGTKTLMVLGSWQRQGSPAARWSSH
jgi:Lrp/AsnC family leucine-responsive transcriptional regulator